MGIGVDVSTHTVYVANSLDNTVSVIDEKTNKVVAGIIFTVSPFNGGHIECDRSKLIASTDQQFYLWPGSECIAVPSQGFEFGSWQENLKGNASQIIKIPSSLSTLDYILGALHLRTDKPESSLNITRFGSFTANFKALPPPIPPEYVATLFTVVATAFVGSWLTPTIIGWRKAKNQGNRLNHYHIKIEDLYNNGKLNKSNIEGLNNLRDDITDEYTRGKITKEQYDKLGDEISISYKEIFTKEMALIDNSSENDKLKLLSGIKSNIDDMHAKRKINNTDYTDLKEFHCYMKPLRKG